MQLPNQLPNSHGKPGEPFTTFQGQYCATLNSMPDAIHVTDSDLRILLINSQFLQWIQALGLEIDNPIGKHLFEVFPFLNSRIEQEYRQVFETGQLLTTVDVTEVQGNQVTTETRKIPTCENGRVTQVVTVIRDMTEHEKTKKKTKATEERIRLLFETIPHALYECDTQGVITFTNPAYAQITGYSTEELLGMRIEDLILPGPQKDEIAGYLEYLIKEQPAPTPYFAKNVRKDGRIIDIEVNWTYQQDDQGHAIGFMCILSDITQRKKAEDALNRSEEQFRSLVAHIPGVVWRTDSTGNTHYISTNMEKISGYSPDEVYAGGSELWFGRIHPDERAEVQESFRLLMEEGIPLDVEYRYRTKEGQWIWLQDKSTGTFEEEGIKYADGVFIDVSVRKEAEQVLLESEARFRNMSEAAFEGIAFGENKVLIDANKAFLEIFGYTYDEAIGKPVIDLVAPDDRKLVIQRMTSGFEGVYEHRGLHKKGYLIDLEVHGSNITYQGRTIRMTAIRDITERKATERRLLQYQERLKSLSNELILTEEREKSRLAEELHDDVGQCLAFCKMTLQSAISSLETHDAVDELQSVCETLTESMDHIKNLTYGLSCPLLKELGLEKAIGIWLEDAIVQKHNVSTKLHIDNHGTALTRETEAFLYRATRELVTNAVKHGHPNQIQVNIYRAEAGVTVHVEDNGDGFDATLTEISSQNGFGLFSIRERLDNLGGQLDMTSSPGRGCKAVLTVPSM